MVNISDKNDDKKNSLRQNVSREIFGEPTEELESEEFLQSEEGEIIGRLNPDEDYTGEGASGARYTMKKTDVLTNETLDECGDDIDTNWQDSTASEEVAMGENPTSDQDKVDSLSEPWGTDYAPEEQLNVEKKVRLLEQKRENDENK